MSNSETLTLDVDWITDSEGVEGVKNEIKEAIDLGNYPKSVELVSYGFDKWDRPVATISVRQDEVLAFYTGYCGGDREQAEYELNDRGISF